MKTKGRFTVAALLILSIAVIGCGKLNQEEFEMWKNEHVAQIDKTNAEIKTQISTLDGKVDQQKKEAMEAISKAKDEAIAASQQGDADTIAAANQSSKEADAKLRADLIKSIDMQGKKSMDFAKAEVEKAQKDSKANADGLKAVVNDIKAIASQVIALEGKFAELQMDVAAKPTLLATVNFASGQTGLSSKSKEMLDGIVEQIIENSDAEVHVIGHADGAPVLRGSYRSNWDLSQARANAAAKYLTSKGIDTGRITAVGMAHTNPVAPQNTAAGRAMNRRVEVILNPPGSKK